MKSNIVEIKELNKICDGEHLINNFNLSVEEGEILALIASDNSRRSLIIKLMAGLVKRSSGEIKYFGKVIKKKVDHLIRIGILIDGMDFYDHLSGLENIKLYIKPYITRISKLESSKRISIEERITECFHLFNLESKKDVLVGKYSAGMKQRLRLIRVLVIEPDLMILENPTIYLDPIATKILKDKLVELSSNRKVTVIIATAMLDFIDGLASQFALLHSGEIIEQVKSKELKVNQISYLQIKSLEVSKIIFLIERKLSIFEYEVVNDYTLRILNDYYDSNSIIKLLVSNNVIINEIKYGTDSLESYFLERIGD